jgi:hypothetical protein
MGLPKFENVSEETKQAIRKVWDDYQKAEQDRRNQPIVGA